MTRTLEELNRLRDAGASNKPEVKTLALAVYENGLPLHRCYWNDRFGIAMAFELDRGRQVEAAKRVVLNGFAGYYEPISHHKFNINKILEELGIPVEILPRSRGIYPDYHDLSGIVTTEIGRIFNFDSSAIKL